MSMVYFSVVKKVIATQLLIITAKRNHCETTAKRNHCETTAKRNYCETTAKRNHFETRFQTQFYINDSYNFLSTNICNTLIHELLNLFYRNQSDTYHFSKSLEFFKFSKTQTPWKMIERFSTQFQMAYCTLRNETENEVFVPSSSIILNLHK